MWDFILSYSLIDFIPIEPEIYTRLFERINEALWPLPLVLALLGFGVMALVLLKPNRWVYLLLALAWFFVGTCFFLLYLAELTWAAHYVGALFIFQGVLFVGVSIKHPAQKPPSHAAKYTGIVLGFVGAVIYPLWPVFNTQSVNTAQVFALAPDPSSLITLGALLVVGFRPWWLILIPVFWCLFNLAIYLSY